MSVKIEFSGLDYFEAIVDDKKVGNLDIYTDDNGLNWLNGIEVNIKYRRKGIATKMIKRAIKEFGEVYISTASQTQHNDNNDFTARYLCDDGADLVNKLIERKIVKRKWMKNPFGDY